MSKRDPQKMNRDRFLLPHILRMAESVQKFVRGVSKAQFDANYEKQAAVRHEIGTLGDSVKELSATFKTNHPSIPWRSMSRMRDRLFHGYLGINSDAVWTTAKEDIPVLVMRLKKIIARPTSQTDQEVASVYGRTHRSPRRLK